MPTKTDASPTRTTWPLDGYRHLTSGQDVIDNYTASWACTGVTPSSTARPWEGTQFDFEVLNYLNEHLYGHCDIEPLDPPMLPVLGLYDHVVPYRLWDEASPSSADLLAVRRKRPHPSMRKSGSVHH